MTTADMDHDMPTFDQQDGFHMTDSNENNVNLKGLNTEDFDTGSTQENGLYAPEPSAEVNGIKINATYGQDGFEENTSNDEDVHRYVEDLVENTSNKEDVHRYVEDLVHDTVKGYYDHVEDDQEMEGSGGKFEEGANYTFDDRESNLVNFADDQQDSTSNTEMDSYPILLPEDKMDVPISPENSELNNANIENSFSSHANTENDMFDRPLVSNDFAQSDELLNQQNTSDGFVANEFEQDRLQSFVTPDIHFDNEPENHENNNRNNNEFESSETTNQNEQRYSGYEADQENESNFEDDIAVNEKQYDQHFEDNNEIKEKQLDNPFEDNSEIKEKQPDKAFEDKSEIEEKQSDNAFENDFEIKEKQNDNPFEDNSEIKENQSFIGAEDDSEIKEMQYNNPFGDNREFKEEKSYSHFEDDSEIKEKQFDNPTSPENLVEYPDMDNEFTQNQNHFQPGTDQAYELNTGVNSEAEAEQFDIPTSSGERLDPIGNEAATSENTGLGTAATDDQGDFGSWKDSEQEPHFEESSGAIEEVSDIPKQSHDIIDDDSSGTLRSESADIESAGSQVVSPTCQEAVTDDDSDIMVNGLVSPSTEREPTEPIVPVQFDQDYAEPIVAALDEDKKNIVDEFDAFDPHTISSTLEPEVDSQPGSNEKGTDKYVHEIPSVIDDVEGKESDSQEQAVPSADTIEDNPTFETNKDAQEVSNDVEESKQLSEEQIPQNEPTADSSEVAEAAQLPNGSAAIDTQQDKPNDVQEVKANDVDLKKAVEAFDAAASGIKQVDATSIKSFANPPSLVTRVMEATFILLDRASKPLAWPACKKRLTDKNLENAMKKYDKDNVPSDVIELIRNQYLSNEEFSLKNVTSVSKPCAKFYKWVCAIERYDRVKSGSTWSRPTTSKETASASTSAPSKNVGKASTAPKSTRPKHSTPVDTEKSKKVKPPTGKPASGGLQKSAPSKLTKPVDESRRKSAPPATKSTKTPMQTEKSAKPPGVSSAKPARSTSAKKPVGGVDKVRASATGTKPKDPAKDPDRRKSAPKPVKSAGVSEKDSAAGEDILKSIKKSDITELKYLKLPPQLVKVVLECLWVILNGLKKPEGDMWKECQKMILDSKFLLRLKKYDKDNIPNEVMEVVRKKYTSKPQFDPSEVKKKSAACAGLCSWILELEKHHQKSKEAPANEAASQPNEEEIMISPRHSTPRQPECQDAKDNAVSTEDDEVKATLF